jgi:Uncharacterized membrane-associated protein/domain
VSSSAINAVYALKRVSSAESAILAYIASRLGKKGVAWPNQATVSVATKVSKSTVIRSLKDLERDGYIDRQRRNRPDGSRSSDIYTLLCAQAGFTEPPVRSSQQSATTTPRLQVIDGGAPAKSKVS